MIRNRLKSISPPLRSITRYYSVDLNGIALAHQLGNVMDAVPFTLVVNQQGQIIHRHPGTFSREQIIEIITPLLTGDTSSKSKV